MIKKLWGIFLVLFLLGGCASTPVVKEEINGPLIVDKDIPSEANDLSVESEDSFFGDFPVANAVKEVITGSEDYNLSEF